MSAPVCSEDRRSLIERLERGEGSIEEAEAWLAQLKTQDPYFTQSDRMHGLEIGVRSRRILERIIVDQGTQPTREQLIAIVQNLLVAEGSEEEHLARLNYLGRFVVDPQIADYIYWPADGVEMRAEAIVDRALAYKPIQL